MAIGTCWRAGAWADPTWRTGAWKDAGPFTSGRGLAATLTHLPTLTATLTLDGGMGLLSLSNDGDLALTNLRVRRTGTVITDAAPTWAIYGPTGAAVGEATGAMTPDGVGGYTATVESSAFTSLVEGDRYRLAVTVSYAGEDGEWNLTGYVQRRGAS